MGIHFELQQVSPRTVAVVDEQLASNAGALVLDDYIVAVDATMRPDTARTFRALLEETYRRPVKYLCVTHYHGDHVLGLKAFKDVTLFASAPLVANMQSRMKSDWTPEALAAWKVEDPAAAEWLDEVELIIPPLLLHNRLDIVNREKVIEFHQAGGHTSCSTFGYYPDERILFAGDLIFAGQLPYAGDVTCDPERWITTLKTWLTWDIAKVIPGHGPITDQGEIQKQLEFFEALKSATRETLAARKEPQDIIMPTLYTVDKEGHWLVERAQKHWYEYYRNYETENSSTAGRTTPN
ncbi:Metallo-beta-lactamase type 2 [Thermoflexales bacterium]|nr:Metallo-beta-lactamase type 2 [Thermoflexales bacterium]